MKLKLKNLWPKKQVDPSNSTEVEPRLITSNNKGLWEDAVSTVLLILVAFLIALFTKAYVIQPYIVDGQSMETTLQNHDRLLVNKLPRTFARLTGHQYTPHRGDIIIFNQSGLPGYTGPKQLIKRIVGLPGDHIVVKSGSITIYNSSHPGGFDPDKSGAYHIAATSSPGDGDVDLTLNSHQVFVCGDNRDHSEDSRYFGPVTTSNIVGKLAFRIFPLSKAQHF